MWFKWKDDPARKDLKIDGDDPDHITWIYDHALARAKEFGIEGVTYKLTQGVVKRIIPAIASTNAIIAASCANEAYKIATNCAGWLDNWMMYNGGDSVYSSTTPYEKSADCMVCSGALILKVEKEMTVLQLVDHLIKDTERFADITEPSLSLSKEDGNLSFIYTTGFLASTTTQFHHQKLHDLISDGDQIVVMNKGCANKFITIVWKK